MHFFVRFFSHGKKKRSVELTKFLARHETPARKFRSKLPEYSVQVDQRSCEVGQNSGNLTAGISGALILCQKFVCNPAGLSFPRVHVTHFMHLAKNAEHPEREGCICFAGLPKGATAQRNPREPLVHSTVSIYLQLQEVNVVPLISINDREFPDVIKILPP